MSGLHRAGHYSEKVGLIMADEHNPVAWAVVNPSGGTRFLGVTKDDAQQEATASERVVPVYWPVLTDAEREAVERGYCSLMGVEDMSAECTRWDAEAAATLRGLLSRTGDCPTPDNAADWDSGTTERK